MAKRTLPLVLTWRRRGPKLRSPAHPAAARCRALSHLVLVTYPLPLQHLYMERLFMAQADYDP